MKNMIRQKAKSALSILLTLCMVLSIMSVGIASFGAADVDLSKSGGNYSGFDNVNNVNLWIYGSGNSGYVNGVKNTNQSFAMSSNGTNEWKYTSLYFQTNKTGNNWDYNSKFQVYFNNDSNEHLYSSNYHTYNATGNYDHVWTGNSDSKFSIPATSSGYKKVDVYLKTKVNTGGDDFSQVYISMSDVSTLSGTITASRTSMTAGQTSTISGTVSNGSGSYSSKSFSITKKSGDSSATTPTINSSGTFTAPTVRSKTVYTASYTVTDTLCPTLSVTKTVDITVIPTIYTPTIEFANNALNGGDGVDATLTVTNHSDINTQASSYYHYDLYKGTTKLTSGTDYTYSNGVFTLSDVSTDDSATYYVQAVTDNTSQFTSSSKSSGASLTVYSPQYCLVGNVNRNALVVDGAVFTPTNISGDNTWWNTWQEGLRIDTPTGTPGVYSFTFTVNEDAANDRGDSINLGLYLEGVGQKAFILDGVPYNTSSGDITITDNGIADGDNLYAYNLASVLPGGSLIFKRGQTYTITVDQREQYDSSSPYGKITISAADAFVDTTAKKQVFNSTDRVYEAVTDATASYGTVSATPLHETKNSGFSSVLTATVTNANYDFIGFYTNEACTTGLIPASSCTNSGSTYTYTLTGINETVSYYALFKQKQPSEYAVNVIQPGSASGSFVITGGTAAASDTEASTTAYAGATVSLSATPATGKEFANWRITSADTGRDITASVMSSSSLATSSFVMPSSGVTVMAVFRDRTPVTISVSSNNTSLGSAARTDSATYYVGDSGIPITATPTTGLTGGVFVRWQITGGTVANATSATTTFTATAANVSITAIFENKSFQLYYGDVKYTMLRQSDGTYVSTRTVTGTTSFTIYDVSGKTYARPRTSTGDYELNSPSWLSHNFEAAWNSSATAYKYKLNSNISSNSYYVVFNPSSGTYGGISIVATNPLGTIAQVYAKDGSIRYSADGSTSGDLWEKDGGGTTANRGVTTITKINDTAVPNPDSKRYPSTGLNEHLKIYSAPIGSTITIRTEVNSTYKNLGFYVGMFVVNGWKVAATKASEGVYTATYTLSDDYDIVDKNSNKSFEITPVYYNSNFEYITFYVDADSVPSEWGNTISVCANYEGAENAHFEGTYPGQPLGREGDLYEIKVSKYYYSLSGTTWTRQPNYQPAATITAYNYDNVHHYYYVEKDETLNTGNNNYQTYDYSDFAQLAKIRNIESILFRCQKETSKTNRDASINVDSTRPADTAVNTYHLLTDYYGNPIDALGNRIMNTTTGEYYTAEEGAALTAANAQIKIVSCGNISNDNKKSTNAQDVAYQNWRTKGNWITAWKVFDASSSSTHIAVGSPADFININANTDQAAAYGFSYASGKSASDLSGKITFISYEKELTNNSSLSGVSTDTGQRIDGQWFYSAMSDFDSDVKVAITTAENASDAAISTTGATTLETDTNAANNTGYIGDTSGTKATLDSNTTHTYSNVSTEAELKATVGAGYTFVGWYIKDGDKYTKIHDNFTDINTTMTMKKNYTIVAVVKEIPAGSLVLTHSRYTGENPEAFTGTGKYYISAKVYSKSGDTYTEITSKSQPEALNSITIPGLSPTDYIEITLRTVCDGDDTFYAWYEEALGDNYERTGSYYEICDENVDPIGQKEVSYTFFKASCAKFFEGDELKRSSLDFYSNITHVSAFANITYKYYDRFSVNGNGQMASYTVKNIELDPTEIENGYIPSNETIAKYAPDVIDTIYKDTKWVITDVGNKVQRMAANVTVMATQPDKDCYVQYVPYDNVPDQIVGELGEIIPVDEIAELSNTSTAYNSLIVKDDVDPSVATDAEDFLISAPETFEKNGNTYHFVRFDVYRITSRISHTLGEVMFSSNDSTFGYRIFADCVIYPVYSTDAVTKTLTATIAPAVLNREVFGTNTSITDRFYADLIIACINTSSVNGKIPEVVKDNIPSESGYTIETGMIVDRAKVLSTDDYNYLTTQAQSGLDDNTQDIILNYNGGYTGKFTTEAGSAAITNLMEDRAVDNSTGYVLDTYTKTSTYSDGTDSHTLTKYVNNNSDLTNKNRIDKVLRFTNNEAARKYIFAAYSYVVIRTTDGALVSTAISNPEYFNFCYVGSKPIESVS